MFKISQLLSVPVLTGLLWLGSLPLLNAQPANPAPVTLEKDLARAQACLHTNYNRTIAITSGLLKRLRQQNQVDTPFGLQVQLTQASAFEKDNQEKLALPALLRIEQVSRQKKLWEIHAQTCLTLALVYEKKEFGDRSRRQLDLAKADIDRYGLDAVYPRFAVRMASWHSWFNDKDSALFFARKAARTAPNYGLLSEEADGHLLIMNLVRNYKEGLRSALRATSIYQKMGDKETTIVMLYNIARVHHRGGAFPLSVIYCDSALVGANQLRAAGRQLNAMLLSALSYNLRGRNYEQMGRLDSALVNVKRGHALESEAQRLQEIVKIKEIDARYQTQLNQKQIKDQQLALQLKDNQLRFSVIIVLLVVASAIGLFLAYRKQGQDKQTLTNQNALIQRQASQLKDLSAAKSRFFANVSHELRTPLTLLLGPVGTLLHENQLTDKQTHLLHLAHRSGRQLQQLVTDILDLGKLELGKLDLDVKPTPVAAFFRPYFAQFESLAASRHLHYTFAIGVPNAVVASIDRAKCRQILNNLLANAVKFTPAGGQITATLTLTDSNLYLRVTDTGRGIHPDDLPHLFDRYFQTTRPDKPAEGGTGIGLALCQEFVQLMEGGIEVDSVPGEGSVFRVVFPVVIGSADSLQPDTEAADWPVSAPAAAPPTPPAADRPTILVVEDNPDLQAYVRLILSDNYEVVTAENGQIALERLRMVGSGSSAVSLILSDIMMPVMDGHQLLERLKADDATRHLPVIMLTARADARDKLRALRVGVDDYLLKPFDEAELLARIANLLASQTARQQASAGPTQPPPTADGPHPVLGQADQDWLETFEGYVCQRIADATFTVPELAHQFSMSESTLLRQLKRQTGLTPVQYIQAVRLEEARRLLESRAYHSVAQVATKVGYDNPRSFSQSFRARFGKLPSELLES